MLGGSVPPEGHGFLGRTKHTASLPGSQLSVLGSNSERMALLTPKTECCSPVVRLPALHRREQLVIEGPDPLLHML